MVEPTADTATDHVDPRAPRFGQAVTATGLVLGILVHYAFVYAVTALLVLAVASRWRLDAYAVLWKRVVADRVERAEPEPVAPHRFAKVLGAAGASLGTVLLLAADMVPGYGLELVGLIVAGSVAVAAGIAAVTGFCFGCRLYRGVVVLRQRGVI